ncbi:MAG: hypothetical protein U0Q07_06685 [Acidimicrobiales bacterium]
MTTADGPGSPTKAIVYVTAEGLPDAWVANQNEIEVRVTQPDSAVEAVIVVPLAEARSWAADVYAAVTIAYREHTGDPSALSDFELAAMPDPGRVVFESLAGRWHEPDPDVTRLRAELGLDDGANGSSSLGSSG